VLAGRAGLLERYAEWAARYRDPSRKLLWMHAPSVGEGLQALPVLQLMRARRPDVQIAYTFYSPSAAHFASRLEADFADYLPFDTVEDARRAIACLAPNALVFSKLDIWPLLTETAAELGVKLGVVSGALSLHSRRGGMLGRQLLGDAYGKFDAVGAATPGDAERFRAQGVPYARVSVTGDTRYDQVWERAGRAATPLVESLRSVRPTVVAGSTWPSDERRLLKAWAGVMKGLPRTRIVIAPHEISEVHISGILAWAKMHGRSAARIDDAAPDTDVIVVDRVGVLGDLYALGHIAYVGGAFHRAGLHSVLEPAAFGMPVLFGPKHTKSADAANLLTARGAVVVRDATDIERWILRFFYSDDERQIAGGRAKEMVKRGLGAAERSFALVSRLLD